MSKQRNKAITKSGHFIKQDVSEFDASFFGISSTEAAAMDPQHRLMTEVTYEAVESAGLTLKELQGSKTGVWMGHFTSDYKEMLYRDPDGAPPYAATSLQKTSLANRISWLWDLRGPSLTLDTACSSSLVALHLACQSLRIGECDMAIVGGSNLMLGPEVFIFFGGQGFLSPDGKSKSFDISADGYGRGEGFAAVILKRADDAIRDADPMRAVIRGTACNQDGHTKGFTLPSSDAQTSLIKEVYAQARLGYEETNYVEAHGTGTQAGDVEETLALSKTLSLSHSAANKLLVGSVKSNIGHLEAGAGLAAVIKSVLVLEHGMIPPNINLETPNPKIRFEDWNLKVPTSLTPFPASKGKYGVRRISVNSFGYGGTNAHAIVDDAASYLKSRAVVNGLHFTRAIGGHRELATDRGKFQSAAMAPRTMKRLYPITSQDRNGLSRTKKALALYLKSQPVTSLSEVQQINLLQDVAFTLSKKRSLFQWKTYAAASSSSVQDFARVLEEKDASVAETLSSSAPRLGFVFTGQGAQWPAMGMELFETYDVFRDSIQSADAYLRDELGCQWSAIQELGETVKAKSKISIAEYSQPLCTILQLALVDLLRDWNIVPHSVTGHSSGEIAAAYCIGALSRESAWKVAYFRGTLATALRRTAPDMKGCMMALGLGPDAALDMIARAKVEGLVNVACVNSPSSVTISGDAAGIDKVLIAAEEQGAFARKLQVDTAYHSFHMQMVAHDYVQSIYDLEVEPTAAESNICMHTSITGTAVDDPEDLGPAHWVRNLISPVLFASAIQNLVRPLETKSNVRPRENAVQILVEIGPHSALRGPSLQSLKSIGVTNVPYFSALKRSEDGVDSALSLAGTLFSHGVPVDFAAVNQDKSSKRVPQTLVHLPSYQWNHSHTYWAESRLAREFRLREFSGRSLIGAPCPLTSSEERVWRGFLRLEEQPWVVDHKINDSILYPAAGFLAMAIEGVRQLDFYQTLDKPRVVKGFRFRDVRFMAAMVLFPDNQAIEHTLSLQSQPDDDWYRFTVASSGDGQVLTRNCAGLVLVEYEDEDNPDSHASAEELEVTGSYKAATSLCNDAIDPKEFYETLEQIGIQYGPCFANVTSLLSSSNTAVGSIAIPEVGSTTADTGDGPEDFYLERPHIVHPAFLDAVFHLCFAALMGDGKKMESAMVPTYIEEICLSTRLPIDVGKQLKGFCHAKRVGLKNIEADLAIMDEQEKRPLLTIQGFYCTQVDGSTSGDSDAKASAITKKYASKMIWRPHLQLLSDEDLRRWIRPKAGTIDEVLAEYIKLLHHIDPGLSVLEVTSAEVPRVVIGSLMRFGMLPLLNTAKYTVCAPNDSLIDGIKGLLQSVSAEVCDLVELAVVDFFSSTPTKISERANPRTADLIITMDLCTRERADIHRALRNTSAHLSSKGRLLLVEHDSGNASSLRQLAHEAGLNIETELEAGSGVVVVLRTSETAGGQYQSGGMKMTEKQVTLLTHSSASEAIDTFLTALVESLLSAGFLPSVVRWDPTRVHSLQGKTIISLLELVSPFWRDLAESPAETGEAAFIAAKNMITSAQSVFWVTGFADPAAEMVTGIARVVRNEMPGLGFRTLNIHDALDLRAAQLVYKAFDEHDWIQPDDAEFKLEGGVLQVNRVVADDAANDEMNKLLREGKAAMTRPMEKVTLGSLKKNRCLRLAIESAPDYNSLHFVEEQFSPENSVETEELADDEVEIAIKASCVSGADLATVKGQTRSDPSVLGMEASGVITRVGSKQIQGKLKLGNRVMVLAQGAHRTLLRTKADYVGIVPAGMTYEEAASIPFALATAWYALVYLSRLSSSRERHVLIHDVSSAVGQQALRIARYLGLTTFVIVDSLSQADFAIETLCVKRSDILILSSTNVFSLAHAIKQLTPGRRGVDVVVDCSGKLAGETLRQTNKALASSGHFIRCVAGNNSSGHGTFIASAPAIKFTADQTHVNTTMSSVDITNLLHSRPDLVADVLQHAFKFLHEFKGHKSRPVRSFPVSNIAAAFREIEEDSAGRVVLTYSAKDVITAKLSARPADGSTCLSHSVCLDPEAIYVLSGGLGGLGRSLSTFLVNKLGARKLLFLSRSGATAPSARQLLADLEASEARPLLAAYACDVSDRAQLTDAVSRAESEMDGTVKGVIQCAMVLRDVLWSNMSYKQWVQSTLPKVQGTANLSSMLPDVDFFISLSSFAGVFGNRGQANYAAGNCYQDALARHRRGPLGLKSGLTIDVPIMRGIGVLAETGVLDSLREWEEPYGIDEAEFHHIMKLAIRRDMTLNRGQIHDDLILGIATGASVQAAGIPTPYYLKSEAKFSIMDKTDMMFLKSYPDKFATSSGKAEDKQESIQTIVSRAKGLVEASDAITRELVKRVAKMQQVALEEIDASRFLHSYGVDSLVAIEIANWALREMKSKINVFDVMAGIPITGLAEKIARKSELIPTEARAG
ncbi:fatty acid synthase S-acetyltransferase [Colletotrichum nymphaeae SA-01]|uniref:Fatty acid synthase S-acetyltransferase n=1 Tax=Colletotrichum nymphaeae SA-01 TaxID=1460502 RepID=A0A135U9J7_9PEZI|nr:fatty acid synthase S-acetyltransferase [Colletotrichum nymphaeae SA-01]